MSAHDKSYAASTIVATRDPLGTAAHLEAVIELDDPAALLACCVVIDCQSAWYGGDSTLG